MGSEMCIRDSYSGKHKKYAGSGGTATTVEYNNDDSSFGDDPTGIRRHCNAEALCTGSHGNR